MTLLAGFLGTGRFLPSNTARLALFANWSVENVSALDEMDGDMHTMKLILPPPLSDSLRTLVSLEFLNGIWVLLLSISEDMQ